jgi:prepilin-type processing-associated H-X9-DG protein
MFFRYGRKYLGSFGAKLKCEYCGKTLKNMEIEFIEDNMFVSQWEKIASNRANAYFCDGHLQKYFKKLKEEYLLELI